MENDSHHRTALQEAVDHLPLHLSMQDIDNPGLLDALEARLAAYHFQSMALYLRRFVREIPGPGHGFELAVDDEDGVYYLYCGGVGGIEVDEDHFDDDQALDDYCQKQSQALEAFAQDLNDSPWRTMKSMRKMVERLNEVSWERDEIDDAIAEVMDEAGYQGQAFIASLAAHEIEMATPEARSIATRRPGL